MLQSGKRGYTGALSAFEGSHMQVARAINLGNLPTRNPDEPQLIWSYCNPPKLLHALCIVSRER